MSTEDDPILQRGFCLTILEKNWKTDTVMELFFRIL